MKKDILNDILNIPRKIISLANFWYFPRNEPENENLLNLGINFEDWFPDPYKFALGFSIPNQNEESPRMRAKSATNRKSVNSQLDRYLKFSKVRNIVTVQKNEITKSMQTINTNVENINHASENLFRKIKGYSTTKSNRISLVKSRNNEVYPTLNPNASSSHKWSSHVSKLRLSNPNWVNLNSVPRKSTITNQSPNNRNNSKSPTKTLLITEQTKLNKYLDELYKSEQNSKLVYGVRNADIKRLDTEEYLFESVLVKKKEPESRNKHRVLRKVPLFARQQNMLSKMLGFLQPEPPSPKE